MNRVGPILFSVLMLGAVLAPVLRHPDDDSYPLSTYPMFSHGRASPRTHVTHVVAVSESGERVIVPPFEIVSAEVLQAQVTIARAVQAGPQATRRFCREIAARIAHSADPKLRAATSVEVETALIDAIEYLGGRHDPIETQVHARCRGAR